MYHQWYSLKPIGTVRCVPALNHPDGNISVVDGLSRWGIKGSVEAGEGLTGVYRFEHKINIQDGSMPGGRLSYVGLSGGFGTLTLGQVWSASYNQVGSMLDRSWYYGSAGTSLRVGNAVSYAFSNDLMSMQIDAIYDEDAALEDNPNDDLEKVEFGLSVNIGDMGKVAISHTDNKYLEVDEDKNNLIDAEDTVRRIKNQYDRRGNFCE